MVLVTAVAACLVSAAFWPVMRRILIVVVILLLIAFLISRIPSTNANLKAYRLLWGLMSHVAIESFRQGLTQYNQWGRRVIAHHHL